MKIKNKEKKVSPQFPASVFQLQQVNLVAFEADITSVLA